MINVTGPQLRKLQKRLGTDAAIAKEIGCSTQWIWRLRKRYGIPGRRKVSVETEMIRIRSEDKKRMVALTKKLNRFRSNRYFNTDTLAVALKHLEASICSECGDICRPKRCTCGVQF